MTKEEFLNYLYDNNEDLNDLIIIEYLFENYKSYEKENGNLVLPVARITRSFGIECTISHTFGNHTAGIFNCTNKKSFTMK